MMCYIFFFLNLFLLFFLLLSHWGQEEEKEKTVKEIYLTAPVKSCVRLYEP